MESYLKSKLNVKSTDAPVQLKKTVLKIFVKKFSFIGMSKDAGPDKTVEESKPVSITAKIYLSALNFNETVQKGLNSPYQQYPDPLYHSGLTKLTYTTISYSSFPLLSMATTNNYHTTK